MKVVRLEVFNHPRDIKTLEKAMRKLRALGWRMSGLEIDLLRRRRREELARRLSMRDPPCVVCGAWSEDWLCPSCRERFWWMHPEVDENGL